MKSILSLVGERNLVAGNASGEEFFLASLAGAGRGGENLKIFPARGGLARILVKFCPAGAGHVSQNEPIPRQNDLIPRQNDPIPRQNEPIPRHGEKKVKIFLAGEGLARKKVKIFLAEAGLARKNLDF